MEGEEIRLLNKTQENQMDAYLEETRNSQLLANKFYGFQIVDTRH